MTRSTADGIKFSRLRRRFVGCFDWTMHLDILVQLIILNNDEQDLLGTTGQYLATLAGVFCGPRDIVVGTSYSTDQPGSILCSGFTLNHTAPCPQTYRVESAPGEPHLACHASNLYFPFCLMPTSLMPGPSSLTTLSLYIFVLFFVVGFVFPFVFFVFDF